MGTDNTFFTIMACFSSDALVLSTIESGLFKRQGIVHGLQRETLQTMHNILTFEKP